MSKIIKQDKPKSKKLFANKKLVLILAIVLLFVVGAVGGWLYMQNRQAEENRNKQITEEVVDQVTTDAQAMARTGNPDGAAAKYDDAIKSTGDSYQKSILTINKAIIYLNEENYEQALKIAKEAEAINVNFVVVKIIAQIYEEKGDKQNAIEYYKKTIALIDKDDPMAADDASYYQGIIDSLEGGAKS